MAFFERSSTLAASLDNAQRGSGCVPYDPNAKPPTYGYDPDLYVLLCPLLSPLSSAGHIEGAHSSDMFQGLLKVTGKVKLTLISFCRGAGIVFTIVFFVSMLAHMVQVTISRKWWYFALALGAFGTHSLRRPKKPNVLKNYFRRMPWLGWAGRCPPLSIQQDSVLSSNLYSHHLYA